MEPLPYIPSWLKKKAERGDDSKALDIVQKLNSNEKSPWCGRIRFADEAKKLPRHTIKQAVFVLSVKNHLLSKKHPFNQFTDEMRFGILMNFWIAVERVFVGYSDMSDTKTHSTVFKQASLEFFHSIFAPVINQLARKRKYTVDTIEECICSAKGYLDDEERILFPDYWQSGGPAAQQNKGGMAKLATVFSEALKHANDDDIEI